MTNANAGPLKGYPDLRLVTTPLMGTDLITGHLRLRKMASRGLLALIVEELFVVGNAEDLRDETLTLQAPNHASRQASQRKEHEVNEQQAIEIIRLLHSLDVTGWVLIGGVFGLIGVTLGK